MKYVIIKNASENYFEVHDKDVENCRRYEDSCNVRLINGRGNYANFMVSKSHIFNTESECINYIILSLISDEAKKEIANSRALFWDDRENNVPYTKNLNKSLDEIFIFVRNAIRHRNKEINRTNRRILKEQASEK